MRSSFDNDECHVTACRPISEAAHSWSYDKMPLAAKMACDAVQYSCNYPCYIHLLVINSLLEIDVYHQLLFIMLLLLSVI